MATKKGVYVCVCVILKRRNDTELNLTLWLINLTPSLHYVCVRGYAFLLSSLHNVVGR